MSKSYKHDFPIYKKYPKLVYLDSAATTLKPQVVIDTLVDYYTNYSANIHRGVYSISDKATEEYEKARQKVADFLGAAGAKEIVFTSGSTGSVNLVTQGWGEANVHEGDEVILSEIDHHSNIVPWQVLCRRQKAILRYIPFSRDFLLDLETLKNMVTERTKVVSLCHISNVLGTINPIGEIVKVVKERNPETLVMVDGAQSAGHLPVNVQDLGVDFYLFSAHKVYGPTGVGVLWGKYDLLRKMTPATYGGGAIREVSWGDVVLQEAPQKFEAGTPAIAETIAMGTAVEYVNSVGREKIAEEENKLVGYALENLLKIPGITIYGPTDLKKRSGVISMTIAGVHPHDAAEVLNRYQVCVRGGHHCAMPLHTKLGVNGTLRASLGLYNDEMDVDTLVKGLQEVSQLFKVSYGRAVS